MIDNYPPGFDKVAWYDINRGVIDLSLSGDFYGLEPTQTMIFVA